MKESGTRPKLALGIDLGTTYFKLGLFDREGELRGLGRVPVRCDHPAAERVELPAERFCELLAAGFEEALRQAGAGRDQVAAVSYSSQANTFLLLDERDRPLTPLVLWTDRRATKMPAALREVWSRGDKLSVTGAEGSAPTGALCKALWFREHEPALWRRARRLLTLSDYFVYALTGRAVGDMGTASLLGMLDVRRKTWWPDVLEAAGIEAGMLAEPVMPGTCVGPLLPDTPLPLPAAIPLTAGSLDHYVASLGAGIGHKAPASASIGTVLALVAADTAFRPRAGCLAGPGFAGAHPYSALAYDPEGGCLLEWYRATQAPDLDFSELARLAAETPPGCDGLRLRPNPRQAPGLEGFEGRTRRHGHGHFARAIMEATAESMGRLRTHLWPEAPPARIVATGGGGRCPFWLGLMSAATGATFIPADCPEPATRGAALLAWSALRPARE